MYQKTSSPLLVYLIDVKAWIGLKGKLIDHGEDITSRLTSIIEVYCWLNTGRWECEVFLTVGSISARLVETLELGHERSVETEHIVVCLDKWYDWDFLLGVDELTNNGVVNQSPCSRC